MTTEKALKIIGQVCGHAMTDAALDSQRAIAEAFLVVTAPEQPPPKSETVEAE